MKKYILSILLAFFSLSLLSCAGITYKEKRKAKRKVAASDFDKGEEVIWEEHYSRDHHDGRFFRSR